MAGSERAVVEAADVLDAHRGERDAVELHRALEGVERGLVEHAAGLDLVDLGVAVAGVGEAVDERSVGGEDEQPGGVAVEAPGGDDALAHAAEQAVDRLAAALLAAAEHAAGLVEEERADGGGAARGRGDAAAGDDDDVALGMLDAEAGLADDRAVDGDGPAGDDRGAVAAGIDAEAGEDALETVGHGGRGGDRGAGRGARSGAAF